jgi:hypothetical protein
MLEAAVADARRAEDENIQPNPAGLEKAGQVLSDVLRDAREKINSMGSFVSTRSETAPSGQQDEPAGSQSVEDDLARRRERLSKPK